jgi:pilus assembly protein CpaE
MKTLIVSSSTSDPIALQLRALLHSRMEGNEPSTLSYANFENGALHGHVDLAMLVLCTDVDSGLEVLRRMRRAVDGHVLAVGHANDSKMILRALQDGADYFLNQDELASEFETGMARLRLKRGNQPSPGRLVAVLSASGGTGASTLAANIATVLAKDEQKSALIDLKPGRGDLASLLDLKPQFTIADLCSNAQRLDRTMLERMLVRHASGVHLLGSPQKFQDIRQVTPAGVIEGLRLAKMSFPFVVVDLEDCFHEEQIVALRQADSILLVTRLDFTSLRSCRRILEHLQELDVPPANVRVIVNRHGQPNELPVDEAEDALGQKLTQFIPEDAKTVNGANNIGIPVVSHAPKTRVAQAMVGVARACLDRRRTETLHGVRLR